jgi:peroxiredoxin
VELYAISVDTPEDSRRLRKRLGADFTFLSDPDGKVLDLFKIRHHQPNPKNRDIAMPTSILVDRDGIIRWIYQAGDYRVRARPEEVFRAIDRLR